MVERFFNLSIKIKAPQTITIRLLTVCEALIPWLIGHKQSHYLSNFDFVKLT